MEQTEDTFSTGEAPDSASDEESEEEGSPALVPVLGSAVPEAHGDTWEPTAEMLAEYEETQTGKQHALYTYAVMSKPHLA